MWKLKFRHLLNKRDLVEHLTVAEFPPSGKDEDGNPIDTITMQYQESLSAYQDWYKKDLRACSTVLYCMHDNLIGEFEMCPTAKRMRDQLKICL